MRCNLLQTRVTQVLVGAIVNYPLKGDEVKYVVPHKYKCAEERVPRMRAAESWAGHLPTITQLSPGDQLFPPALGLPRKSQD